MKILTVYYSETGQTEKIARAINNAVPENNESSIEKLKKINVDSLADYDLVFIGGPCHDADLAKPVKKFLNKIPSNPKFKLAGFFTHSCLPPESGEEDKLLFQRWVGKCAPTFEKIAAEKKIAFQGYFRCMGAASKLIENFIHRKIITDEKKWAEYLPDLRMRPNTEDIENAQKFALKILAQIEL